MKEKICGIYSITNKINNKRLIGSSKDIESRCRKHKCLLTHKKHNNPHLQLAFNQYGILNFQFEIIEKCDENNLLELEDYYIKELNTIDKNWGYNFKEASRPNHSQETRLKMSMSHRGVPLSQEHRMHIGLSHIGKVQSIECKNRISIARKGKIFTDEHKRKLSEAHMGKKKKTNFLKKKLS